MWAATGWPRIERAVEDSRDGAATALAAALIIGAFAIVLAGLRSEFFDLERHSVPKELILHATALFCVVVLTRSWRRLSLGVVGATLGAFVAWSGMSALFATNSWLSLRAFGVTFSGYVIYRAARRIAWGADSRSDHRGGYAMPDGLPTPGAGEPRAWRGRRARAVLAGLAGAALLAAAIGIAQAYGYDAEWLAARRAPGGTFGNRNFLAHLLAIAAPGMLLLALAPAFEGQRALRWLGVAALAAAAAAIVLTRSRAAWLGLTAGAAVMLLCGGVFGQRALAGRLTGGVVRAAVVGLVVAVAAAVLLPNRLEWRSDSPYAETLARIGDFREGSGRGRLIQYGNSLDLVGLRPVLGVGPGNWFVHYPRVTQPGDPSFAAADPIPTNPWPSSDWIAFVSERGPVGALLLFAAGAMAVVIVLRRLSVTAYPGAGATAGAGIALAGTLAATFVTGAFDAVLLLAAPTFFVFVTLGLLLPPTRPVIEWTPNARVAQGLRAAAVAIATVLVLSSTGQVAAIRIAGDGRDRAALERAVRFDPGNHRLRLALARRGGCSRGIAHARAAEQLMPYHDTPRTALRACGERPNRN